MGRIVRLAGVALLATGCTRPNPAYEDGGDTSDPSVGEQGGPSTTGSAGDGIDGTEGGGAATGSGDGGSTGGEGTSGSGGGLPTCDEACDEDASCVADDDGPECVCNEGFEGDGRACMVAPSLEPLRWQLDCLGDGAAHCDDADTCYVEAPGDHHEVVRTASATMVGEPGVTYEVTLRVRGVVEPKAYEGGSTRGHWNEGGSEVEPEWNSAWLRVTAPYRELYMNAGGLTARYCLEIDEQIVVSVTTGATVEIGTRDPNNCAMHNLHMPQADGGMPITLDGVMDPPQPHDGQFVVVEAEAFAVADG